MSRAVRTPILVALAAAATGAAIATSLIGGARAPAATPPPPVATVAVTRNALTTTVIAAGSLAHGAAGPVVDQLPGTVTWLPRDGQVIDRAGVLLRVDNAPVFLLLGGTPAWRPLARGMTDGPDVAELQANLVALGDAHGLFTEPDGHFGPATAAAVERWQEHEGLTVTGSVPLGEVVFLSSRVRVDHLSLPLGEAAIPGGSPFVVSTTRPVVTVPVNPALPPVHPGERVDVRLASGQSIRASVTTVGSAITLVPLRPLPASARAGDGVQVAFPVQSVHGALTVPVSALLALAGGGYGLEVVRPAGPHHIVGVRTGLFAGGRVAVSGGGIDAGTRVVSAQ